MSVEERKEAETRDADFDRATAEICRFLPGDKIPPPFLLFVALWSRSPALRFFPTSMETSGP